MRAKISYMAWQKHKTVKELFFDAIIKSHEQLCESGEISKPFSNLDRFQSRRIIEIIEEDKGHLIKRLLEATDKGFTTPSADTVDEEQQVRSFAEAS